MTKNIVLASTVSYGGCCVLLCISIATTHWVYGHVVSSEEDMKWHIGIFNGCVTHLRTGITVCVPLTVMKNNNEFPGLLKEYVAAACLLIYCILLVATVGVGLLNLNHADSTAKVRSVMKTQAEIGSGRMFSIAFGTTYFMIQNYHDLGVDGGIGWSFYIACVCAALDIGITILLCIKMPKNPNQQRVQRIEPSQSTMNTPALF